MGPTGQIFTKKKCTNGWMGKGKVKGFYESEKGLRNEWKENVRGPT
jgi:hypothetical protein